MKVDFRCGKCDTIIRSFERPEPQDCIPTLEFSTSDVGPCPFCHKDVG